MGHVGWGCQTYPVPLAFPVKSTHTGAALSASWLNVLAVLEHISTIPRLFRYWTGLEVHKRGFDPRISPGFNINLAKLFCLCVFIATFWQYGLQKLRTLIAYVLPNTQSSSFPLFSALLLICTSFSVPALPHSASQNSLPAFPLLQPSTADPLLLFDFPVLHINANSHQFLGQGKCGHRAQTGRCFFIL